MKGRLYACTAVGRERVRGGMGESERGDRVQWPEILRQQPIRGRRAFPADLSSNLGTRGR